jgi:hypothetical protein
MSVHWGEGVGLDRSERPSLTLTGPHCFLNTSVLPFKGALSRSTYLDA